MSAVRKTLLLTPVLIAVGSLLRVAAAEAAIGMRRLPTER